MYELLLRTEALFAGLRPLELLAVGIPAIVTGLVLWLGGTRYSTAIIGLLGAVVGAACGLVLSQWLTLHLWLSMIVGAAVLATASVLLRNVLILVLAVIVVAAAAGGGYLAIALDKAVPKEDAETQAQGKTDRSVLFQSLGSPDERLDYVDRLSRQEADFAEKVSAIGKDTWKTAQPHLWKLALSVVAGAAVAIFLVWFIKKALIALAYSIVGAATLFMGAQAALLAAGFSGVSMLQARPWTLPATFLTMTAFGWVWQLFSSRAKGGKEQEKETKESD